MDDRTPLIEVRDLCHTYTGNGTGPVEALRGITLTLRQGEFVALVGPNGSGKTTLARHLNGLLLPTRGEVRVAGLDTRDRAAWPRIRSVVAMVFQRPGDQIVATTVEDDVAFGPQNLGLSGDEIEGRVHWALETVGMWQLRRRSPHLLSAGQQQRVAIAGALAMNPRCVILDEATAMLDPRGRREIFDLLQRLQSCGITILLITHRLEEAAQAERLVALAGGQVAFDGSPRGLLTNPQQLRRLGLEPPILADLAARLAKRWPDFPPNLLYLDELVAAIHEALPCRSAPPPRRPPASHPQTSTDAPAVRIRGLSHTYLAGTPFATPALKRVDLEIQTGEVVALLGPTGSGKSTLLEHIAGLLRPMEGKVVVAGHDPWDPHTDRRAFRQAVGMLFQRPEGQLFETYVGDDVAFGPRRLGLDPEAVRERVRWAMDAAGVPFSKYKDRFTQGLSAGEQRKVALAGVLALRPRILLLDEPTADLDPRARRELVELVRRLNREVGTTLVVVTHSMDLAASIAHRMVILQEGQVVEQGRPCRLLARPDRLVAYGLELPAIAQLAHRLQATGVPFPADLLTVDEAVAALEAMRKRCLISACSTI